MFDAISLNFIGGIQGLNSGGNDHARGSSPVNQEINLWECVCYMGDRREENTTVELFTHSYNLEEIRTHLFIFHLREFDCSISLIGTGVDIFV